MELLFLFFCLFVDDKNPCHLPEAPGPCRALLSRYFFDSKTQRCKRFYYGGCYGNANNFKTLEQCQVKCQNPGRSGWTCPFKDLTEHLKLYSECFKYVVFWWKKDYLTYLHD